MGNLDGVLRPLVDIASVEHPGGIPLKRGPHPKHGVVMTPAERQRKLRAPKKAARLKHIAILDTETDPFDRMSDTDIRPFVAELYSDQFGSIVIWEEDFERFIEKLYNAIISLPDEYTIYAHNGGKFDFLFLVKKLRGPVKFKGRAIMVAKIGNHELRDSLHILPEKLAAWKKDHFDYSKMKRANRHKFRQQILDYLHSDCVYLFDIVKSFLNEFGFKISIGQAAFSELRKSYKVDHIKEPTDEFLRKFFFGGRVECIAGRGLFDSSEFSHRGGFKLYDVNAMYPDIMANCQHPTSSEYLTRRGEPDGNTIFIDLECRNYGALVSRLSDFEAGPEKERGRFYTTIWEYETALRHGLIEDVKINWCIDNPVRTNFSKFIVPMYERRQFVKAEMRRLKNDGKQDTPEYEEHKKQDLFLKYLLNNSFGKFAQNPRNFREYYYTDPGEAPDAEWLEFLKGCDDETAHKYGMPVERCDDFFIWAKPSPGRRFNNVGTAASITGAARAKLLDAIQVAIDPVYCDTDSIICRELKHAEIHPSKLGAWDIEEEFDQVIIAGKKEYACRVSGLADGHERRLKVRCKGADLRIRPTHRDGTEIPDATSLQWEAANAATWAKYIAILDDQILTEVAKAPTITRTGEQYYMTRRIRATAPRVATPLGQRAKGLRHAG